MVADLHLHEHQEHFFGLMIWLMPKIWGYQKDLWLYRMLIQT
jgi:hypothetical protein